MSTRVTIIGAGHGAHAAAVELTQRGCEITLTNRRIASWDAVARQGGIRYTGELGEGFAPVERIEPDLGAAVRAADVVMLVVPSTAHELYARALAPHLTDGAVVFLNPGHMGGSLHVAAELRRQGNSSRVRIGETATLTYATRLREPGLIWIKRVVRNLYCSTFPARDAREVFPQLAALFPNLIPADHALSIGFLDLNAVEHPPGVILNAGWIEFTKGNFRFYYEGITPGVARVIELVDAERVAIIRELNRRGGLGISEETFVQYFHRAGYTTDEAAATGSVYQALQHAEPNKSTMAPDSFEHRYMVEDVAFGLVPMCEFARLVRVPTPHMTSLITLASAMTGRDFAREGRTLAKMGLEGRTVKGLRSVLTRGFVGA
jgi:opine dehydrogenase